MVLLQPNPPAGNSPNLGVSHHLEVIQISMQLTSKAGLVQVLSYALFAATHYFTYPQRDGGLGQPLAMLSQEQVLNQGPVTWKSAALPTELSWWIPAFTIHNNPNLKYCSRLTNKTTVHSSALPIIITNNSDNIVYIPKDITVTVVISIIPLHSGIPNDLTSHLTGPMFSKGLKILQEVKNRGTIFW